MAQLGARLDGIEEVVGSNPIGSTKLFEISETPKGEGNFTLRADRSKMKLSKWQSQLPSQLPFLP